MALRIFSLRPLADPARPARRNPTPDESRNQVQYKCSLSVILDSVELFHPIGGRIRDAPEGGCGSCELYCNLSRSRQFLLHVDHAALFLFPLLVFCIRSLCSGVTFSTKAISAPCALTTRVCVLSEN